MYDEEQEAWNGYLSSIFDLCRPGLGAGYGKDRAD
jgi:hypothetical protein